jgi:hypothetical protein
MNNTTRPSISRLVEELKYAREHVDRIENTIRNCNLVRVQAFKEEFNALVERYGDVELSVCFQGASGTAVVARTNNPTGLGYEEVKLF